MNIKLLLAPDFIPRTKFALPPMGIASISAMLRSDGHKVEQDDLDIKSRNIELSVFSRTDEIERYLLKNSSFPELEHTLDSLLNLTRTKGFDVFGLSVAEPSHLVAALCLAKRIKDLTKAIIVIGGRVSISQSLLRYGFIDYVITGDAEHSFSSLLRCLEGKSSLQNVPGLAYRDTAVKQNPVVQSDLESIPAPDFEGLPIELYCHNAFDTVDPYYETYNKPFPLGSDSKVLMLPYLLTKGCSFSCSFCGVSASKKQSILYKSAEKIAAELDSLKKKYRTRYFFLMDSTLNCSYKWLEDVCGKISSADILWSDSATPMHFPAGLLRKMRSAGCVRLTWGVESLSDPILKKMSKPFTAEIAKSTLKDSHDAGIWNYTNWVAGFPHETESMLNETLANIRTSKAWIDDYTVTGFILQQSEIYNSPQKYCINIGAKSSYLDSAKDRMETDSFDEIGGLSWKDKQKQIDDFRRRMVAALGNSLNPLPMHTVFYLYDKFHDKESVLSWLRSIGL
ncbi:MAG: radical SAM protein [Candidatus Woesearchaeota archaeon]